MAGDAGFDPLGLSNIDDVGIDLYWMREAELKHARVAMMAAAGVLWVEIFGPFPGWVRQRLQVSKITAERSMEILPAHFASPPVCFRSSLPLDNFSPRGALDRQPAPTGGSQTDAFWDAWAEKPNYIAAALAIISLLETISGVAATKGRETGLREPGDFKLNPLEFEINEDMKTKEIANGRLAMIAVAGFIVQGMTTHHPAIVGNLVQGI